jgi:hypothetical protein
MSLVIVCTVHFIHCKCINSIDKLLKNVSNMGTEPPSLEMNYFSLAVAKNVLFFPMINSCIVLMNRLQSIELKRALCLFLMDEIAP